MSDNKEKCQNCYHYSQSHSSCDIQLPAWFDDFGIDRQVVPDQCCDLWKPNLPIADAATMTISIKAMDSEDVLRCLRANGNLQRALRDKEEDDAAIN